MGSVALARLDEEISLLAYEEQLRLVERIAHRLRSLTASAAEEEHELAAMAADPEIIRENRAIAGEFALAESDGLEELS